MPLTVTLSVCVRAKAFNVDISKWVRRWVGGWVRSGLRYGFSAMSARVRLTVVRVRFSVRLKLGVVGVKIWV